MFTAKHFIWIGLCAVTVVFLCRLSLRKSWSLRQAGLVMMGIGAVSEISKILSHMTESPAGGMHLSPKALPFHLCSLMLFLLPILTFGRAGRIKQQLIDFVAAMGAIGSVCAILIPTSGTDFSTLPAYQCFVYHAGLLWFSLYLIASGQTCLKDWHSFAANVGLLLGLVFAALYLNGALAAYDTNFFYLTRPPMAGLPYLNLRQGWYAYFGRLLALGFGVLALFYLPFVCAGLRRRTPAAAR